MKYSQLVISLILALVFSSSVVSGQKQDDGIDLEAIFRSNDQSVLSNNYILSHDPVPHAWEYFTQSQSPIGRILFPDVMAIPVGHIYTLDDDDNLVMHQMKTREWLPWLYETSDNHVKVARTVNKDVFQAKVTRDGKRKGLILLQVNKFTDPYYRYPENIKMSFDELQGKTVFTWNNFTFSVSFRNATHVTVCQDPEPVLRAFSGFNDVVIIPESVKGCWDRNGIVWIAAHFNESADVVVAVSVDNQQVNTLSFEEAVEEERNRWVQFFKEMVPKIQLEDPVFRDTWFFAWKTLFANYCEGGNGSTPDPFFAPTRLHYSSEWYWDDAYISIILRHLKDADLPYLFLKNFSKAQFPDGGIPGSLSFAQPLPSPLPAVCTGMQPPVVAVTLQLLKDKPGWPVDIKPMYDMFLKNALWHYSKHRDTDQDGLVEYHNTYDSSADMSPRFTPQLISKDRYDGPIRPTESVEYNVWMAILWENLGIMADRLGYKKDAKVHYKKAKDIEQKIHSMMWDEEDGFYYDLDAATKSRIKVMTPYGFNVMLLKNGNKERYKRMIEEHLYNTNEFWGEFPVPTVPYNHPDFDEKHMWMGPVWINCNWLIIEGLHRQGFNKEAKELATKTVKMVGSVYQEGKRARTPQVVEWYGSPKGEPLGNDHFSWSCLVNDLIIRFLSKGN